MESRNLTNNTKDLNLVDSNDLSEFLESLGELSHVHKGQRKCKFCMDVVTMDNIFVVFRESGEIKYVCRKEECISKAMIYMRNKKNHGR